MKNNKGLIVMRGTNGETTICDPNESEFGTRKSKVTSIRVDPELYEKFKEAVDYQGKQVSSVVASMMADHVNSVEKMVVANKQANVRKTTFIQKLELNGDFQPMKTSRIAYAELTSMFSVGLGETNSSLMSRIIQNEISRHQFDPAKTKTFVEKYEGTDITGILLVEEKC